MMEPGPREWVCHYFVVVILSVLGNTYGRGCPSLVNWKRDCEESFFRNFAKTKQSIDLVRGCIGLRYKRRWTCWCAMIPTIIQL